jgi:outer membrane protein assembly factor BamB
VVSILPEEGRLHCASGGRLYALDPNNGELLWTNELKGMGTGLAFLSSMQNSQPESITLLAAQAAANAAKQSNSGAI